MVLRCPSSSFPPHADFLVTESDSDDEIQHYTNRGNKLKKRALFAHQGQLIPPSGPEVYRQVRRPRQALLVPV
jgi:hypothetical protein